MFGTNEQTLVFTLLCVYCAWNHNAIWREEKKKTKHQRMPRWCSWAKLHFDAALFRAPRRPSSILCVFVLVHFVHIANVHNKTTEWPQFMSSEMMDFAFRLTFSLLQHTRTDSRKKKKKQRREEKKWFCLRLFRHSNIITIINMHRNTKYNYVRAALTTGSANQHRMQFSLAVCIIRLRFFCVCAVNFFIHFIVMFHLKR